MTTTGQNQTSPGRHRNPNGKPSPDDSRTARRTRLRSRARRLEVIGLLIGLVAGAVVAALVGTHEGPPRSSGPAAPLPATTAPRVVTEAGQGVSAAALDAEWATYSDDSTCADWAGADGVSAVRLSSSQLAWFFSDTYLGPAGPTTGFSGNSGFIHNSVVIQTTTGQDSKFVTMTGGGACSAPGHPAGPPAAVVGPPQAPGQPDDRYWDEDGIEVGGTVVKFYNRYLPGGIPYVATGTVIAAFPASQLSAGGNGPAYGAVARPALTALPSYTPPGDSAPVVWGASVLRVGGTIYVYGTQTPDTPVPDRQMYLARVPASRLTQFGAWQFWAGDGQWAAAQQDAQPVTSPTVSSGFSVVEIGQRYWLIQADPVAGSQDVDAFPGAAPWGPFDQSGGMTLYGDPSIGISAAHDYRIMYEARVEPALSTSKTLVISYNVNSLAVNTGCVPLSAYTNTVTHPRFIEVPLTVFGSGGPAQGAVVRVGPSDYPRIVPQDPSQWFNEWNYPSGCPPVPGLTDLRALPGANTVLLSWHNAGLGVRYQVYLLAPGAGSYARKTTTRSGSATLSGLNAGSYLAKVVPVNLHETAGPPAEVTFTIP